MSFLRVCGSSLAIVLATSVSANSTVDINAAQLSCLLEPSQQVDISSQAPGVVNVVHMERGDQVRKGQKLLELDSAIQNAAYVTAKARASFAKRKVARNKNLLEKKLLSDCFKLEPTGGSFIRDVGVAIWLTELIAYASLRSSAISSPGVSTFGGSR